MIDNLLKNGKCENNAPLSKQLIVEMNLQICCQMLPVDGSMTMAEF